MATRVKSRLNKDQERQMKDFMGGISGEAVDDEIAFPKYIRMHKILLQTVRILETFGVSEVSKLFQSQKEGFNGVTEFAKKIKIKIGEEPVVKENYQSVYLDLKKCEEMHLLINTCGNLTQYKAFIEKKEDFDDGFIRRFPGEDMRIFPFCKLNFKIVIMHPNSTPEHSKYVLLTLHMLHKNIMQLYNLNMEPDIDIQKFSEVLILAIETAETQIPRCTEAFKLIKSKTNMLSSNFGTYYRGYVQTQNPGSIIESFITDVVKEKGSMQPEIVRQFRTIMTFFNKNAANQKMDPKAKQMLKLMNVNMGALERQMSKSEKDLLPEDHKYFDDTIAMSQKIMSNMLQKDAPVEEQEQEHEQEQEQEQEEEKESKGAGSGESN